MYTRSHWSWIHPWTERIRTKFMKRFYVPELFRCCVLSKVKKSSDSDSSLPGLYYKWSILEWPSGWAGQGRDKIKISQEIWFKNQKYPVKLLTLQRSEFKCCGLERGFCWWCFHDHGQEIWELRKLPKLSLMDLKRSFTLRQTEYNSEPWHWWELVGIDTDTGYWCEIMSRLFV